MIHKQMSTRYERQARHVGRLVDAKNQAYGDAIHVVPELLKILYPRGIRHKEMRDATLIIRVLDKLVRLTRGEKHAFGEDPWLDICGYSLRGLGRFKRPVKYRRLSTRRRRKLAEAYKMAA